MNISTTYKWINSNQFLYFKYKTNVYITITKSKSDKSGFIPFSPSPTPHPAHLHTKYYYYICCCCTAYTHCSSYKKVMLKYKKPIYWLDAVLDWIVAFSQYLFLLTVLYCTVQYCTVLYHHSMLLPCVTAEYTAQLRWMGCYPSLTNQNTDAARGTQLPHHCGTWKPIKGWVYNQVTFS